MSDSNPDPFTWEAHGGTVQADPLPGGGTLFTLLLPQPDKPPIVEPG